MSVIVRAGAVSAGDDPVAQLADIVHMFHFEKKRGTAARTSMNWPAGGGVRYDKMVAYDLHNRDRQTVPTQRLHFTQNVRETNTPANNYVLAAIIKALNKCAFGDARWKMLEAARKRLQVPSPMPNDPDVHNASPSSKYPSVVPPKYEELLAAAQRVMEM
jgi:hypothetical protein